VLGDVNPLTLHKFHALPVFYRVRILYTLISSSIAGAGPEGVEAHKYPGGSRNDALVFKQKLMEYESKDMRGQMLGEDSAGDRYFYCPQFDTSDFRLYRQAQKVTLKQRQEAKKLEEEKARASGKGGGGGRKRGSAAVADEPNAEEPKKKAKAKAKPKAKVKPKAKKPKAPAKPKKVPRQGSRRSGRGQRDPEPTPEEEVAKMEAEQQAEAAAAAAAAEAEAEAANQLEQEQAAEVKEEPAAATAGVEDEQPVKLEEAAPAPVEVNAEDAEVAAATGAAAAAAPAVDAPAATVQDHEAKVWEKLSAERKAATEYVETYCAAPEVREMFEIICDEMSAEGAWGEFVYQMGISKVRTRQAYGCCTAALIQQGCFVCHTHACAASRWWVAF
jgi:hypothetical protein